MVAFSGAIRFTAYHCFMEIESLSQKAGNDQTTVWASSPQRDFNCKLTWSEKVVSWFDP